MGSRSRCSFAERGYALPLVLLGIALFLVYASETTARVVREARIARVKTNAVIAYYAAEAGFNRARARVIGGGTVADMEALHGVGETFYDGDVQPNGTYTIEITTEFDGDGNPSYLVVSTGTYGAGKYQATRVVSGLVTPLNPLNLSVPRPVHTAYQ